MILAFLSPATSRSILLILLGAGYIGYHLLCWWRHREKMREMAKAEMRRHSSEKDLKGWQSAPANPTIVPADDPDGPPSGRSDGTCTGEDLFNRARSLRHQKIPDFKRDGAYLELLGNSAAAGYAPAMAKLGEYAMRRAAWVEAYYWMASAKQRGMDDLADVMRMIRNCWSLDGCPDQRSNVNGIFTAEAGSLGLALLNIDSGRETAQAKEFLKANHPEFMSFYDAPASA